MNEGTIAGGEVVAGVLQSGGECINMNRLRGDSFGGGQSGVKVVDFEIPAGGKRRESAAGIAGKACPSVNCKRQILRPINGFEQRRPFLQVVAGERESQR